MDNREAQFVLNAYRPGGEDAGDAQFMGAMAQAQRDPALGQWLRESIAFDDAIVNRLASVSPPRDLRENILAGAKLNRRTQSVVPWLNRLAIAALLLVAMTIGYVVMREKSQPRLAGWQTQALAKLEALVSKRAEFDAESAKPHELISWLAAHHAPVVETLPAKLATLTSLGCKTFEWNGTSVSIVCFVREDGGMVHLVIARSPSIRGTAANLSPVFLQNDHWNTASWHDSQNAYMLAMEGSTEQLRKLL